MVEDISAGRGVISFKVNRKLLVQVRLTQLFHCEKMNSIEFAYSDNNLLNSVYFRKCWSLLGRGRMRNSG